MTDHGVVIVGGGLAAAKVAEGLRERGYSGSVTLIGEESEFPYERPDLSKRMLLEADAVEPHFAVEPAWFKEHAVDTRLGVRVEQIERERAVVLLSDGTEIPYAHLVLATGARPRVPSIPGVELPGVHSLRTLSDARELKALLTPGRRWVIVGAGWIGLEVAAAARQAGGEVTVLETAPQPLRVLGTKLGNYFAELHRSHGVDLRFGVTVEGIIDEGGRAAGVRTSAGDVPADVVLVAAGAVPNAELAQRALLDVENGILTDEHLRTKDQSILAVGDVANSFNTKLQQRLRVEHWDNAIRQGKLAAATITGAAETYDWEPYFYTDQFDLGMEFVGRNAPADDVLIRGDLAKGEFIAFWYTGGRVTAAMNVNIWDVSETLRGIVGRIVPADRLVDEKVPLEEL